MLLAGPSKAGKSFALIEMTIAIAEGKSWFGWRCAQGRVLYVNLELDRASCLHRFRDVYEALDWKPENLGNIDIWNLRGRAVPMDQLAPRLIRRALKKDYVAVVLDPIYKVITGDENSADQMAAFCNQFDKVCTELGCAVIETTLREFPRFAPINLWFDYPIHKADDSGALTDLNAEAEPERVRSAAAKKSPADRRREKEAALDAAYDFLNTGGDGIKLLDMAGYLSVSRNTLKDRLAMHGGYECSNGIVQRVKSVKK